MGWIKRNLFFVVGGLLTLGLLGGAGFYIYKGWSRNSGAFDKLNEIVDNLQSVNSQKPSPGNGKIDNTKTAKEQNNDVGDWIASSVGYFQPIPPIPTGFVTSVTYGGGLSSTINLLQDEARADGVALPPKCDFSFSAQSSALSFAAGSLAPLAAQLGEVKAIAEILFAARINALDSIQRVRVSVDDMNGSQSDYIDEHPVTNDLAIVTPYVITFRCFTPELSRVLAGFATASNTFIIKSVNVQPAGAAGAAAVGAPGQMPPGMAGAQSDMFPMRPGGYAVPPAAGRGGLQTVLKERLLLIKMEVELVKLSPKS